MKPNTKLTTQCPQCGGQFTVSMAQLQLRKGFVRCVHCAHIFDGYETVVPEEGDAWVPDLPASMSGHPAVIRPRTGLPRTPAQDEPFLISDAPSAEAGHTATGRVVDDDDDAIPTPSSEAIYAERRTPPMPVAATLPDFLGNTRRRGWMLWCWSLLSVLALFLLLAQVALVYRVQLASAFPAMRPPLERLCGVWGCRVEYPRNIDKVTILASSLRMQARTEPGDASESRLTLHVRLRNQDARAQQWPALLLDLTDFSGAVVIRKHLFPADYLPASLADEPFASHSELALRLPIVVQRVNVSGYQIRPFFP